MIVSTIIPTRNRPTLLVERAIRSVFAQTYPGWECIVVGDDTDAETQRVMAQVCAVDSRFRFVNLPAEPRPTDPRERWLTGGVRAWNAGLQMARGDWLSYLGDDDVYVPRHHELLLAAARDADFVYGESIVVTAIGQRRSDRVFGRASWPEAHDIVQGAYLARRALDLLGSVVPSIRGAWDAVMLERLLDELKQKPSRIARVAEVVHEYHPAPEHRAWHRLP